MLKKCTAISMALLMAALCLTGCKKENQKDTAAEVEKGSPVVLNGDKIYPIQCDDTLSYWGGLSSTVSTRYSGFAETPLAKEIEKQTGVKVDYIHPSLGQEQEQLQLLIASNELPDIVASAWNNYAGGPQVAIDDGLILNLNDLIDKYAPALKKVLAENETYAKLVKNDDNNYYAFPFLLQEGLLQVFYGPIIRQDWLDKIGMESPETIDEWETVLTAFKEKCGAEIPFCSTVNACLKAFGPGFGVYVDWYLNGQNVVYGPAEPGYGKLLAKLNDWYKKGLIDPDISVVDSKRVTTNILNGKSGVTVGYSGGDIGDMMKAGADIPKFNLVGAKYPAEKKGQIPEYGTLASPVNMGCGAAISTNCKNPELAARFLDYGFTEEGHNLYNFGIEGESYEWIDGYPTYTELITNNPDGWTMTEAMGAYMRSAYNGIMVQDQRYIEQYYKLPQQKEAQKTWMGTNMAEHLLPQLYVESSESDRDGEVMSNIRTYVDEMTLKFITGAEPLEKFDEYIAQLNAFGLSEAKSFRQSAYERFLKR